MASILNFALFAGTACMIVGKDEMISGVKTVYEFCKSKIEGVPAVKAVEPSVEKLAGDLEKLLAEVRTIASAVGKQEVGDNVVGQSSASKAIDELSEMVRFYGEAANNQFEAQRESLVESFGAVGKMNNEFIASNRNLQTTVNTLIEGVTNVIASQSKSEATLNALGAKVDALIAGQGGLAKSVSHIQQTQEFMINALNRIEKGQAALLTKDGVSALLEGQHEVTMRDLRSMVLEMERNILNVISGSAVVDNLANEFDELARSVIDSRSLSSNQQSASTTRSPSPFTSGFGSHGNADLTTEASINTLVNALSTSVGNALNVSINPSATPPTSFGTASSLSANSPSQVQGGLLSATQPVPNQVRDRTPPPTQSSPFAMALPPTTVPPPTRQSPPVTPTKSSSFSGTLNSFAQMYMPVGSLPPATAQSRDPYITASAPTSRPQSPPVTPSVNPLSRSMIESTQTRYELPLPRLASSAIGDNRGVAKTVHTWQPGTHSASGESGVELRRDEGGDEGSDEEEWE